MRALPQKLSRIQVKDSLVNRRAVPAHEHPPGRQAMVHGNLMQCLVPRLAGRIEDDSNIHHDVDK